jgi:hypothetical protein
MSQWLGFIRNGNLKIQKRPPGRWPLMPLQVRADKLAQLSFWLLSAVSIVPTVASLFRSAETNQLASPLLGEWLRE